MTAVLPPPTPKTPSAVNLPNVLTAGRLLLGFVLFGLIAYHLWVAAIAVFAAAAVTDWLDGYVARRQGLSTPLGRNFDPLVDKVVICGAYVFLIPVPGSGVAAWMAVVVVVRELIITSLRSYLENAAVSFGADALGKLKMGLQCAVLIGVFLIAWLRTLPDTADALAVLGWVQLVLLWTMLAATIGSGAQYVVKATKLLR